MNLTVLVSCSNKINKKYLIFSTALPTYSPARHCMKFERKRDVRVNNKQLSILDDNSIASNEYGEEEDGDYNNNGIQDYSDTDQLNSTNVVSAL